MPIKAKVNGGVKEVSNCKVKVGGVWKNVANVFTKVNGVWKQAWRNIIELRKDDSSFHTVPVSGATTSKNIILTDVVLSAMYLDEEFTATEATIEVDDTWTQTNIVYGTRLVAIVAFKVVRNGLYVSFTGGDSTYVSDYGSDIKVTIGGIALK